MGFDKLSPNGRIPIILSLSFNRLRMIGPFDKLRVNGLHRTSSAPTSPPSTGPRCALR